MSHVTIQSDGAVRYIQLDYPLTRNALDMEMAQALLTSINQCNDDPDCNVVIFCSTGRSYFSTGPNINGIAQLIEQGRFQYLEETIAVLNKVVLAIYKLRKFTIAAIHGCAFGGGLNIFLPCDYRLVEVKTLCVEAFFSLGVNMDLGASMFLPMILGEAKTKEVILSGRMFSGAEGWAWGLFHEKCEKRTALFRRTTELAQKICAAHPRVVDQIKRLNRRIGESQLTDALDEELFIMMMLLREHGAAERLRTNASNAMALLNKKSEQGDHP